MAREKSSSSSSSPTGPAPEKRQLIESLGLDRPTGEIIAAAAERGVSVSRTYVEILKKRVGVSAGAARKPGRPRKVASTTATSAPAAVAAPKSRKRGRPVKAATVAAVAPVRAAKTATPAPNGSAELAFRAACVQLVIEAGTARAQSILDGVVARIRASVA